MRELSQHLMDLTENSVRAGAKHVDIEIVEDLQGDRFQMQVRDDGRGMDPKVVARVTDPFFTSRTSRKVGLGLSLLAAAAGRCEGSLTIDSAVGVGTTVTVTFRHSHIDRPPLGDMTSTLISTLVGHAEVDFTYRHRVGTSSFELDGAEIRRELEGVPLTHPSILRWLHQYITEGLTEVGAASAPVREGSDAKVEQPGRVETAETTGPAATEGPR